MRFRIRMMALAGVLAIGGSAAATPSAQAQCGCMNMGGMGMSGMTMGGANSGRYAPSERARGRAPAAAMNMDGMDMSGMDMGASSSPGGPTSPRAVTPTPPAPAPANLQVQATEMTMARVKQADWMAIAAQKTCPVSGKALGSMGAPIKLTYQGSSTYVCCTNCVTSIWVTPDKFFAQSSTLPAVKNGHDDHSH